ncbi:MAG: DNA-3-methyladenine glycosylase, partial [Melioribacteraceae bacterium]|nr:DNA-3-methyladenine glycosylase [Melioribacteraceae bacterium]
GKIFILKDKFSGRKLSARITEVEAYDGCIDEAAHTFRGKTERNKVMFSEGGHLYIYFTYGIHHCANVVTGSANEGTAVLLRAMEPLEGIDIFAFRRFGKTDINEREKYQLLNGPAKICQAFGLDRKNNGASLVGNDVFILHSEHISKNKIVSTRRIGIKKSVDLPWRFYIKNNQFISKM